MEVNVQHVGLHEPEGLRGIGPTRCSGPAGGLPQCLAVQIDSVEKEDLVEVQFRPFAGQPCMDR